MYFTTADLRRAAGSTASSTAEIQLRLHASIQEKQSGFDVFVSHSSRDALLIYGLRTLLIAQGLRVYVDWINDPQLDRARVSAATADRLRERMRSSKSLIYATSRAAQTSRWMPWELGYFDATKGGHRVSILPIEDWSSHAFDGEEYLGLYRTIQKSSLPYDSRLYAVTPGMRAESIGSFARGEGRFESSVRL